METWNHGTMETAETTTVKIARITLNAAGILCIPFLKTPRPQALKLRATLRITPCTSAVKPTPKALSVTGILGDLGTAENTVIKIARITLNAAGILCIPFLKTPRPQAIKLRATLRITPCTSAVKPTPKAQKNYATLR
jgi:hypothetical protein